MEEHQDRNLLKINQVSTERVGFFVHKSSRLYLIRFIFKNHVLFSSKVMGKICILYWLCYELFYVNYLDINPKPGFVHFYSKTKSPVFDWIHIKPSKHLFLFSPPHLKLLHHPSGWTWGDRSSKMWRHSIVKEIWSPSQMAVCVPWSYEEAKPQPSGEWTLWRGWQLP